MSCKIYICVDIEGTTGACHRDDVFQGGNGYNLQCQIMTNELLAVVEGILTINSSAEIYIKDAHNDGRNLIIDQLPSQCVVIRGWDHGPLSMMQNLNSSFDLIYLIGFHSAAGSSGSPLSHTFSSTKYSQISLNDKLMSEFDICYYTALMCDVPVCFLSGDKEICETVKLVNSNIITVATQTGISDSVILNSPQKNYKTLKLESQKALKRIHNHKATLPKTFKLKVSYFKHSEAFKSSFYPGFQKIDSNTIQFETDNFYEILRAFIFI